MIYDMLSNLKLYYKDCGQLSRCAAFIKKLNRSIKDGRYAIDGDAIYASISSYKTKMDTTLPFEAHKKYIDLQCLLAGNERIDIAHGKSFRVKDRYSAKKDILFIHPPEEYSSILLTPGKFTLLYPHDFHRPGQGMGSPEEVRKLVIKIRATGSR